MGISTLMPEHHSAHAHTTMVYIRNKHFKTGIQNITIFSQINKNSDVQGSPPLCKFCHWKQ